MNALFLFEVKHIVKRLTAYLISLLLVLIGIFCGNQFNLTVGEGIYLNSPYTIGFMTGLLSLIIIFFAIIYATQILFKDWDSKFDILIFSYPFSKRTYLQGKFLTFFLQTFLSFTFLMIGFVIGQNLRTGSEIQPYFNFWHYFYPLLIFGGINCLVVCSFLFFISFTTKRKLLVVIGGLFLYVLYMIILVFSNSPFMAGSLPQSLETQQVAALIDPFGISSYFFEATTLSAQQKNELIVPFSGYLLVNRIVFIIISTLFLLLTYRLFSFSTFSPKKSNNKNKNQITGVSFHNTLGQFKTATSAFGGKANLQSVLSFAKIDLIYLFKSITIVAVSILLLFFVGMEMYAEIEKGIRLPQQYASSGLMSTTISENFHLFGMLIVIYFINDLYWRSYSSGFSLIEKSTYFSKSKLSGHFLSASILLIFLSAILILEGLIFQLVYNYFHIDWSAYLGIVLFNTLPLILFSVFMLLINDNIKNRFVALGVSVLAGFTFAGPMSKKVISYPLLRIFSDYKGAYSDFNGYGIYASAFAERLLFGFGLIAFLWLINERIKTKKWNVKQIIFTVIALSIGTFSGSLFMKGYIPKNEDKKMIQSAQYERKFKHYENLPQPTITDVITEIQLYPSENSYKISGTYKLVNQTDKTIDKVLINFHPDLKIESAVFNTHSESQKIDQKVTEIYLKQPLQPGETASLDFKISYRWFAVNGHDSFNSIIENGSFMRISRYYPTFGYQANNEIEDEKKRAEFKLGKQSELKKLEAPEVFKKDFINLDMTISTEKNQIAVGTGDLIKNYTKNKRNYFQYKAGHIPFRFAVSSAKYQTKTTIYKGIAINIYYDRKHSENVNHLIENAKLTLDYCTQNFGKYPFKTINFAEVSSFTKGFAATAYPSAIFMTEDMLFHANINADQNQDVINELAGHELSHLWWGNSQIDPDEREGAVMLTETLAMYTEMMLYKKMHGKEKMMERIEIHQQIYDNEKGLSENQPLYKVTGENTHVSYSKGAVIMVKLCDLIGEDKVNKALRNFLLHNQYPKKPTSLDLLKEFYKVSPNETVKRKIDVLFRSK
ncbi:ABC-2 type transport system permease protein [Chryseobacterium ginsenosidimutans]|uniref:ABC transporter permease/M1 family aminopeptidase n=1 Tax=Chryseobacterium ginsenosidimutans TaxID=687846 RepID=UPI002780FC64|nr:M1 family aminopeptidase [Chryseobacterium ginsenosidimutans]MDQ0593615.1 ABC-2 type transport system permease protein [Chryseobacterium ginsenosidimutans]